MRQLAMRLRRTLIANCQIAVTQLHQDDSPAHLILDMLYWLCRKFLAHDHYATRKSTIRTHEPFTPHAYIPNTYIDMRVCRVRAVSFRRCLLGLLFSHKMNNVAHILRCAFLCACVCASHPKMHLPETTLRILIYIYTYILPFDVDRVIKSYNFIYLLSR